MDGSQELAVTLITGIVFRLVHPVGQLTSCPGRIENAGLLPPCLLQFDVERSTIIDHHVYHIQVS